MAARVQDPVLAIDLEWRPDRRRWESNRVAMIQLASSTVAVLIRTCKLGFRLGPALSKSLRFGQSQPTLMPHAATTEAAQQGPLL